MGAGGERYIPKLQCNMNKGPHVVLNQVLRAERPSRVEGATEECMGDGGATGGQESPRTCFGLCTSLASLFVRQLSELSFPRFILCGSWTFMSVSFLLMNPEQPVIYFCGGSMLLKKHHIDYQPTCTPKWWPPWK